MLFGFFSRKGAREGRGSFVPTVKFDAKRVTEDIRADLWERINEFEDLPDRSQHQIFEAAVIAAERGRDLAHLTGAMTRLGVPRARASYVALYLLNRSTALMNIARSRDMGLKEGRWLYSGAPCHASSNPTAAEQALDAAHRAAGGRVFRLDKGLHVNGVWTYPGLEPGCKCVTTPVVPGFD